VLYRLPELTKAPERMPVFVVEGERKADLLASWGLVATCSPGGAGKWANDHSLALCGRRVVVLPDNDRPGEAHARDVLYGAVSAGAASVRVVSLPGLPEGGDVVDWSALGHGVDDLIRECKGAREWK
jgi:DNA primase